ncbi:MAG: ribonuclease HI [Candidatus Sumerlaeia bacterium]|nr:ribonuclease HI [Candidatus Sumerlaeia bacterium]
MKRVVIHTDGGCQPNPGVGAWAAVLRYGDQSKELVGGDQDTTNNQMELTAAIMSLEALKEPCEVELHTDSEYVKKGLNEWMPGWKRAGWKRKTGELKNVDLWKRLDAATQRHRIQWHWVRGHAGNPDNERCDELCRLEIERRHRSPRR